MKIFGLDISPASKRKQMEIQLREAVQALSSIYGDQTWDQLFSTVNEPYTGAWQRGVKLDRHSLLSFSAVYCCVTGIATDIAKLRIKLSSVDDAGIWTEITRGSPFLPVLRTPNHYQTTIQFLTQWILSKLLHGNAYVLLERDDRGGTARDVGIVKAMYVLDPMRVTPMVADSGEVFYALNEDYLSQVDEAMTIPATEIIHDRMPALFHPLLGTSPLYACAMSTQMGNAIQGNSQHFFQNRSLPGGMLTSPNRITDETADRLKATFEKKFSGNNIGKLLVAGDGIEFKPFAMTAEQSQLVDQLKWSVADVARAFHYPEFKLGGPLPPYAANMQALILSYYTDCLQTLIESLESSLDAGLRLPSGLGTEMDIDNLLRMDAHGMSEVLKNYVGAGVMAPDEGRNKINLKAVPGGKNPYLQQQNYSLEALAKRDAQEDPFAGKTAPPTAAPPAAPPDQPAREVNQSDHELGTERIRALAA